MPLWQREEVQTLLRQIGSELSLAGTEVLCLIAGIQVHRERTLSGFSRPAKPALAGLLALLLLISGTLSVSHTLHQSLHPDGAGDSHFCLVCLFAKGQVNAADVGLVSAAWAFSFFSAIRLASTSPLPGFDYRLSPSRAPPRS